MRWLPGLDPALPPQQQGAALTIVGLSTREYGRHAVALRGELDVVDAAGIMAALAMAVIRNLRIILDLTVQEHTVPGSVGETVRAAGGSRPGRVRGRQLLGGYRR
jgi:hypothetical protein